MPNNGQQLEALVAFVEERLLPAGFFVHTNQRITDSSGTQIAEFDIEIRGKLGSTDISWLIECRDRPSSGPAPASWVEQLVGRRERFRFNRVTAVSTTGFSSGAIEYAQSSGIELREVSALNPEQFSNWLQVLEVHFIERQAHLENTILRVRDTTAPDIQNALKKVLQESNNQNKILRAHQTGIRTSTGDLFASVVKSENPWFANIPISGEQKDFRIQVNFSEDDFFVVDTTAGSIDIVSVIFEGRMLTVTSTTPLQTTAEYRQSNGDVISQIASFAPQKIREMNLAIELHKIAKTGEVHIALRRLPESK